MTCLFKKAFSCHAQHKSSKYIFKITISSKKCWPSSHREGINYSLGLGFWAHSSVFCMDKGWCCAKNTGGETCLQGQEKSCIEQMSSLCYIISEMQTFSSCSFLNIPEPCNTVTAAPWDLTTMQFHCTGTSLVRLTGFTYPCNFQETHTTEAAHLAASTEGRALAEPNRDGGKKSWAALGLSILLMYQKKKMGTEKRSLLSFSAVGWRE